MSIFPYSIFFSTLLPSTEPERIVFLRLLFFDPTKNVTFHYKTKRKKWTKCTNGKFNGSWHPISSRCQRGRRRRRREHLKRSFSFCLISPDANGKFWWQKKTRTELFSRNTKIDRENFFFSRILRVSFFLVVPLILVTTTKKKRGKSESKISSRRIEEWNKTLLDVNLI